METGVEAASTANDGHNRLGVSLADSVVVLRTRK